MIDKESSGNPKAIDNWDSNAKKGAPSKGLMRTIDSTFNANKLQGYDDIYNPVHNIIAGVRYAIAENAGLTPYRQTRASSRMNYCFHTSSPYGPGLSGVSANTRLWWTDGRFIVYRFVTHPLNTSIKPN